MSILNKQIGWSTESNLLWQILKQLNRLSSIIFALQSSGGASVMTGATLSTEGTSGLTPKPIAGQQDLFLRGDATWAAASASLPVKLTSQTLLAASWTLIGDYYTYSFSNLNVTTTCDVSVTPQNASYQTAYNANVLPYVEVAAGVATFYAQFPPVDNMIVDIVITQTT
jgi:hypothetical protein